MAAFVAWVVFSLAYCAVSDAAIAHVLMDAVAVGVPALAGGVPRAMAFVVLFGGLAAVNIRGVRHGTRVAVTTTVAMLVPLLLLVVVGAFAAQLPNLAWSGWPSIEQLGAGALLLFLGHAAWRSR